MDRIAVLSDIHANVWALEAVLEDAIKKNVTQYLNLGDALYGPLEPLKTFHLLQKYPMLTVSGNEDRLIHEAEQEEIQKYPTLAHVIQDLGEEPVQWLQNLDKTALFQDEVFLCHGAIDDDTTYLLEDISDGHQKVKKEDEILELLKGIEVLVILCGHSHVPRMITLSTGQVVVNPGSVGLPAYTDESPCFHVMENYSPKASYVIMEKTGEQWQIELIKVSYNHHDAAQRARELDREDWAGWIMTGRA